MDAGSAKQFFISKIIDEAAFDGVSLSEVEKRMLHFTERGGTNPELLDVAQEFERACDSDEYEEKIIALLRNARDRDVSQSSANLAFWTEAISALKHEDHYVLVMIYRAFSDYRKAILPTDRVRDYLIYIAIAVTLVVILVVISIWRS